jgi:hypothetical protein
MTLGDETLPPALPAIVSSDPLPADTGPSALSSEEPAIPPRPRPRKAVREAREPPPERSTRAERPAGIDPNRLIGLSPEGVAKLIGTPSRVKDDHLSREWVYAAPGCNFRVFFYPNLNAASFRALKYGGSDSNGGNLAASDACVRRILTARANAADD